MLMTSRRGIGPGRIQGLAHATGRGGLVAEPPRQQDDLNAEALAPRAPIGPRVRRLLTLSDFNETIAAGDAIVVTDSATGTRIHCPPCPWVKATYFEMKVIQGRGKNGSYFAFPTLAAAVAAHGNVACPRCTAGGTGGPRRERAPAVRDTSPPSGEHPGGEPNFIVRAKAGLVEAWSAKRLNFLPKDWRESLRAEIEAGVSQLRAGKGERLCAEYISAERGSFDTENLLFFNIDVEGKPFAGCAGEAIRFEHGFEDAPAAAVDAAFDHYHRYEIGGLRSEPRLWACREILARWERQACGSPEAWKRAAHVWKWMKAAKLAALGKLATAPTEFGLRVVLHGPARELNLLKVIKPLFDGIIAAFQADDERSPDEGFRLHAKNAGLPVEEAVAMLRDTSRAVLGRTKLLRRDGLMQPSDDLCMLGEFVRDPETGVGWECSGEVFRVGPRT